MASKFTDYVNQSLTVIYGQRVAAVAYGLGTLAAGHYLVDILSRPKASHPTNL